MPIYKETMECASWLKLRVKTLDDAVFDGVCAQLARKSAVFQPELVVGIRSGGFVVAEKMMRHLPGATLLPITRRRESTAAKEASGIKRLLARLPRGINNGLRIAEHIALTRMRAPRPRDFTPDAAEWEALSAYLAANPKARILIVDDAVDSGATLNAVHDALRALAADATINSAAVTVTTAQPLITPDIYLYRYVLCRFPWSLDAAR